MAIGKIIDRRTRPSAYPKLDEAPARVPANWRTPVSDTERAKTMVTRRAGADAGLVMRMLGLVES